ncbi:hypothetical protein ACINKY_04410 [Paenibacillus illinoisensis]|uniref:Uncharacterized protein n=1 Tax=Paenibacillus illinoisensis TaxID=59845 RepID=A0ABW8HR36_9BACL
MIQPTETLLEWFHSGRPLDMGVIQSYCRVIARYGDREDAAVLLQLYLEHPEDYRYVLLLEVVMRCGDLELARQLHQCSFVNGKLKEEVPGDILHVLAYMGYQLSTKYLVDCVMTDDWYLSKDACLALLHMPCEDQHQRLKDKFEQVYGNAIFPEILPALCAKWAPADKMVPKLLAWGEQASVDCNGGLVWGIAMYGTSQKEQIRNVLWNPNWELYGNGTGSHWWAYMAMPMVGLTFSDLIRDLKDEAGLVTFTDKASSVQTSQEGLTRSVAAEHRFHVFHDLLQLKLESVSHPLRYVMESQESMLNLYQQLFSWSTPHVDDSILGVIAQALGTDHVLVERYNQLRSRMELYVRHEIELDALR